MRRRKKIIEYGLVMLLILFCMGVSVEAHSVEEVKSIDQVEIGQEETMNQEETISQKEIIDYGMGLLDWESIEALENELSSAMPDNVNFDLKDEMLKLMQGEDELSVQRILDYLIRALGQEIKVFFQFGARFILIVLLCNLLQALSSAFKSKNTTKVAFFVGYMIILLSVVQSFRVMIELAILVIDQMTRIMMVCIPILLAFMATSGFNLSAGVMAPVIISALNIMTYLIKVIVLPCIISVIVLEIVSSMSEEFKVSQLISLFYKGIKWSLRSILGVSVALLSLYRLTMPGVDMTLKQGVVKFSSAFIPVVGNAVGGTIDFITKGSILIKNTFAGGIMVWILILVSIPMLKILAYICVYQISGAIIEPLGDKKMAKIAEKLGKGCQFIMSSVGIIILFCMSALVICMTISSNGV